ncbi:MAG: protein phosphatase 2C domain-containing protein [Bradymonadaceae bacterium]|nr:protein phosphatase 2C domain-containing protein [Lujinxingiaceae bacterium]
MATDSPAKSLWLTPGSGFGAAIDATALKLEGAPEGLLVSFKMDELLEHYATRRVFVATAVEVSATGSGLDASVAQVLIEALKKQTYLIEESSNANRASTSALSASVQALVRQPLARGQHGEHDVSVFVDNAGMTIEEIVDISQGQLLFPQVRDIFSAVLDLMSRLHETDHLHLRLAPWNVRILDRNSDDGFPRIFLQQAFDDYLTAPPAESSGSEPRGLVEETFSESAVDAVEDASAAANPFSDRGATLVDVPPLTLTSRDHAGVSASVERDLSEASIFEADLSTGSSAEISEVSHSSPELSPSLAGLFDGVMDFFSIGTDIEISSVVMGFSAPEMMGRSRAPVGELADIFSLGMLLYYLVAGEIPPASVYTRHSPAIPARCFRPAFPPGLQPVIARATRPHPQDRYPNVQEFRRAFDEACDVVELRSNLSPSAAPGMKLASDTHIGIAKKRRNPTNQDHVFSAMADDTRFGLIVVADGVSTASFGSGDLASKALAEEAVLAWEDMLPSYLMDEPMDDVALIQSILNKANQRIVDYVNSKFTPFQGSPHEVMGSTALIAIVRHGVITLASLGDSRTYLQRGAGLEQITIDHNLWTLSILEGVSADSALAMPHGDALARCLGTFLVQQGRLHAVPPQADFFRFTVARGDTVLWTTDGLTDFGGANSLAAEDNILAVMLAEADPSLACLELILLANRGGGGDNLGIAIARFS